MKDGFVFGAWWVWLVILVLATAVAFAVVRPFFLSLETQQNRASQQYVESQEGVVLTLQQERAQLDSEIATLQANGGSEDIIAGKRAQETAIDNRLRFERTKLGGRP